MSVLLLLKSVANLPEDPAEYAKWETGLLASIIDQRGRPPETSIPKLGRWVMQMALPNNVEKGDRPVYNAAQATLLAIPGHAEFYRDRILASRAMVQSHLGDMNLYGPSHAKFWNIRHESFSTLQNLPSLETVRVLGEFLADQWSSPILIHGTDKESPLSVYAVRSLIRLPFTPKPVQTKFDHEALRDLPEWQAWYEQIKSGKRTFRFEGDPTEYDLNGPAPQEKLVRIERDLKRDDERLSGQRKSEPVVESAVVVGNQLLKPSTIAGILAACALVAGAVWYFLRGRRAVRQ